MEFSKFHDGSVDFTEEELTAISKFLSRKDVIIYHIANHCDNIGEINSFVSAVKRIIVTMELWEEKKKGERESE